MAAPHKNCEFKNKKNHKLKILSFRSVIYNLLIAGFIFLYFFIIFFYVKYFPPRALCACGRPHHPPTASYATAWTFPVRGAASFLEQAWVSQFHNRWQAEQVLCLREQSSFRGGNGVLRSVMRAAICNTF
jgi:hypothetical protein